MTIDPLRIRFSLDDAALYGLAADQQATTQHALAHGLAQHVRVGERVLPKLFRATREVEARLGLREELTVFVYASPEINAYVCSGTSDGRILVFVASSLLTALTYDEWHFVIGHELGHNIYGHHRYPRPGHGEPNLRVLELMRAAEISADRAGLIACGNVETTLRAMLKVASGLDERLLDVDIGDYMRQLAELRDLSGNERNWHSTHPPFPVRVRAVLRCDTLLREAAAAGDPASLVAAVDEAVARDLCSSTYGSDGQAFQEEATAAAFWQTAETACRDGVFSTVEQGAMVAEFGDERVAGLKRMLAQANSLEEAKALIRERSHRAQNRLRVSPLIAIERFNAILTRLRQTGFPESLETSQKLFPTD
jgi:hypothetical protein